MDIWLIPTLAFAGGLLGAGIPAWVALRGQRHDSRVEWRQRLDRAIDLIADDERMRRHVGELLLVDLIGSDLGTKSERELAYRVSRLRVHLGSEPVHNGEQEEA